MAEKTSGPESNSNASCRLARLYQVKEAQILLEELPSDLSEEEPDSDIDDPLYEPVPVIGRQLPDALEPSTSAEASNTPAQEAPDVLPERKWKKKSTADSSGDFPYPEGPRIAEFEGCTKPVDFFFKYWDKEIEKNIVEQSNLYLQQKARTYSHFTLPEFRGFMGINMVMGYHTLPSYTQYWSQQPDLLVPVVASTLSKGRFQNFLSCLHVNNDLDKKKSQDKLWKLRPLIDSLNKNFAKLYDVKRDVKREQSIEESMVLFKGRSCLKQYCPMKPIKHGFKLWMRADSDGYISKFSVYQGRGTGTGGAHRENFGLGESVVLDLCEDILGRGHKVFFDNFFTSLPLLSHLREHMTWGCGTIRLNRKGLPQGLAEEKTLKRGDFDYRVSNDGLVFFKWMDSKCVHIASNFHSTDKTSVLRTQKDGTKAEVGCPHAIYDYNKYMGGVDKADQLCGLYGVSRKSKKWWHRMFFGLTDRTLVNSFIAYRQVTKDHLSLLNYVRAVALSLLTLSRPPKMGRPLSASPCPSPVPVKKRRKTEYSVGSAIRLEHVGVHYVVYNADRGRCEVCSVKGIQSRPHSKCHMCNVFLCCNEKKNCFLEFHEINA